MWRQKEFDNSWEWQWKWRWWLWMILAKAMNLRWFYRLVNLKIESITWDWIHICFTFNHKIPTGHQKFDVVHDDRIINSKWNRQKKTSPMKIEEAKSYWVTEHSKSELRKNKKKSWGISVQSIKAEERIEKKWKKKKTWRTRFFFHFVPICIHAHNFYEMNFFFSFFPSHSFSMAWNLCAVFALFWIFLGSLILLRATIEAERLTQR